MAKEDVIKKLTSLKGIGQSKAEALVNGGYDSIKKIQSASIEELTSVKGISETVAQSLKDQLGEESRVEPEKKKPVETQEKKPVEKPVKEPVKEPAKPKKGR